MTRGLVILFAATLLLALAGYALFDRARPFSCFLLTLALGLAILLALALTKVI